MTDVLLGQSYYLRFDPKLWAAQQPYPPLGALYAAACLRAAGCEVALFDSMLARSEREWDERLAHERPRLAVLYEDSFNYLSKMCLLRMREAGLAMIHMARARGCRVLVSGSDATDHPELYLEAGAEFVLIGEAERTLVELCARLLRGDAGDPAAVAGVCTRAPTGELVQTAPRPFIRDLDSLPFPAWDLVDVDRYRRVWGSRHGYHSMNVVSTRGCPYHCNWCAKPIYGQRYAVRSAESVAEELAWLKGRYAPGHVAFADDIFGLQPGWVERFAAAVARRDAAIPFKCLSRADLLGEHVVAALRAAGCRTVWLGAESGSQRILDAMEKGTRVEQIRDAARRLRAAGIEVGFFLQFGYPGETRDDIEKTRALVRECQPDDIGISVSYPLPGTRFHERVKAELGTKRNWADSQDLAMLYRGPFPTPFYRTLHTVVHKEFRLGRLRVRPGRPRWREAASALLHAVTLPLDRRRLSRLARAPHQGLAALPPGLTPEAAAVPSTPPPDRD
jgi:anaerobic magnesium-protoporphyrin IX monomethyl ester cyclase